MPCYQLIAFVKPEATPERLADLFKNLARVVFRESGQFRIVENFGVRPLAYPIRKAGSKYEEVRWVHVLYDISPGALPAVGAMVQADKDVLQYTHLLHDDKLAKFSLSKSKDKVKKFPEAMRWTQETFNPETLSLSPSASTLISQISTTEMR